MQSGKAKSEFSGRYELTLAGTLDGQPWSLAMPGGAQAAATEAIRSCRRHLEYPAQAVVKTLQVRVLDQSGDVRASADRASCEAGTHP